MNTNDLGQLLIEKATVLKPYTARPFKSYSLMTDQELIAGAGGYMIVDTECYPNFWCAYFKDIKTQKILKFEIRSIGNGLFEGFNERQLSWVLHSYTTIGFNSIKYDLPMLWAAYKFQHPELLKEISNDLILTNMWPTELQKKHDFKIWPTRHVDLIEGCPLRGSLKLYGARLHAPRIQDVPFKDYEPLSLEEIEIVSDYCINDLDTTEIQLINLKEQLELRANLSTEYNTDLMSKSDAQIAESVIGNELKKLTGKWPSKPNFETLERFHYYKVPYNMFFQTDYMKGVLNKIANIKFSVNEISNRLEVPEEIKNLNITIGKSIYRMGIGGLHSSEENISYKSNDEYQIYDRDVASYYPMIVLNCGLYPQHIGENFLKVYKTIVDRRIDAKKKKNIAISECLKLTINGTFGKTGSPYSFLYAPEMTIQITVGGQLYLLMLIEKLELAGIQVISANTDGIVMYCHKDQVATYLDIIDMWEKITGFVTEENKYTALYSRDVNAYMAIKDKEIKGKNVYYDPWRAKTARDGYWRFQKNPNGQICVEAIEKLIVDGIPIDKTIKECLDFTKFISVKNVKGGAHKDGNYLGKVVRWYYAKNVIGTINYIISGNKVPDTDGAKECMDLPKEFPNDINYDWYISKTKEMLYDLDYYKRPRQIKFF